MHGFIAVLSLQDNDLQDIPFQWKTPFDFQPKHAKRKLKYANLQIEQFTSELFLKDKYWIDNEEFVFITEGLITNIDKLLDSYQAKDIASLISKLSHNNKDFFKNFTGNFIGLYFHKETKEFIAFNNHAATKRLFYFSNQDYIIYANDLYTLSHSLSYLKITKSLDVEASYLLLTAGFMLDDYTLIQEVKQIRAGEYASYRNGVLQLNFYYHLHDIIENSDSKTVIINTIDELFEEAIHDEFEFERSRGYTPVTTLSAGLDSRMVALVANDLGYTNQVMFNFSEKGFVEETVPKQIAEDYGFDLRQFALSPYGLMDFEDVVAVNDGLNLYSNVSHAYEALKSLDVPNIGMLHTGMIGDAVLGSFLSASRPKQAKITDGVFSTKLIHKAKPIFEKLIAAYKDEVSYKFYNRAYTGANNGFLCYNLLSESTSPFLYPQFLSYALSIPSELAHRQKIYVDWIKAKRPTYAKYIWETIGGKPTNNRLIQIWYRGKRAIIKRLPIHTHWKNTMTPEQIWYDNTPEVKQFLDDYFHKNLEILSFNKTLMEDVNSLYQQGNIVEKTQAITLIAAYRLHFE